jgi:hypothetical protein
MIRKTEKAGISYLLMHIVEKHNLLSRVTGDISQPRLVYELPGIFESMAAGAKGFCLRLSHYPGVRLMAIKTLHALLHVEVVLAHLSLIGVALSQTVG